MTGPTVITRRPERAELVVERTFAAGAARLWRCVTTAEIVRWWGPHGWNTVVHEMDVRPGGTWRYDIAPDAGDHPPVHCLAVYRRVEEPTLLAFDDGYADVDGAPAHDTVPITIAITPDGDRTHLVITTHFADEAQLVAAESGGMDTGLAEALDRLGPHLEEHT